MREPKYKTGDKVKVINYGSLFWESKDTLQLPTGFPSFPVYKEDENFRCVDIAPELVGKRGIIEKVTMTQGVPQYSLTGIKGKCSWYNEDQLKRLSFWDKIKKNLKL